MSATVGEFMLERLHSDWGVKRIYGYPGDGISGLMGAFHELDGSPEFVQVRHEAIASFAACAHAKFTGEVGVCVATSGPGAIQLLNGLYDAKLDRQPVVALVGQQKRVSLGSDWLQEVDLDALMGGVATEFCHTCMAPEQAAHLIDRAMRTAISSRTVACVIVPVDVQHAKAAEPERAHGSVFSAPVLSRPRIVPEDDELRRAADVLNAGKRVAILIGQGAAGAPDEVVETAELLGAGVAKALNGRAALPDDLPFVTGSIGLLGTKPSSDMMGDCDTLLMIGSNFPFADWLPDEGQARGVQIDIDGRLIGMRYPMEVALVGDAGHTLRALIPLLERKEDRGWRERVEDGVERWWRVLEEREQMPADPLNPMRVFGELSPLLPDGCILCADSGTAANWWARHLKLRAGMRAGISGTLATMGCAVPYALGAKFAHPDKPVIAAVGDGAMQMTGMNALIDIAHYADRWEDPRCIVLVLNNGDLNEVTWEQRAMAGDPRFETSQTLPAFPYAGYAELLGLKALRVDEPDAVRPAWEEALAHDGPVLLEAVTDPNMPPLPPQLRFETRAQHDARVREGRPGGARHHAPRHPRHPPGPDHALMASVREVVYEMLRERGMTTVFGNPGSTELPFLAEFPGDFRYVLGLQEIVAVGMADGFAQASGKPTLVNLHTAPGVGNGMGAIFNAQANKSPLVITAGQQSRSLMTLQANLTNRDAARMPHPLVKWSYEPPRAEDVPHALARATHLSSLPPLGPTFVSIPMDDWEAEVDESATAHQLGRTVGARAGADPAAVAELAQRLEAASNPVFVAGPDIDASGAWDDAVALVERQRLPVWATPATGGGRLGFPESHPAFQGILPPAVGPLAETLAAHDLILVAGSSVFPYYPNIPGPLLPEGAALVAITSDPEEAVRAPMGDAIVADVALTLRALLEAVPESEREAPPRRADPEPAEESDPMNPSAALSALAELFPENGIVVLESPSSTPALRNRIRISRPGSYYFAAGGGLGFGLAAAVGVQLAQPDRPVVCVIGEGSVQYSVQALWSAVAYRAPVTFLVLRNDEYAILKWFAELESVTGAPGLDLPALDSAAIAEGYGMQVARAAERDALGQALSDALAAEEPRLVEARVSPGMALA